jgi:hypothetical protein
MIRDILYALEYDFKGKYIDIAKGKYKMPETFKEGIEQFKRELCKQQK